MIELDNTLVADALAEEKFVCDLSRCKGACCVEGESGAPLEMDELKTLEAIYPSVKPYMTPEGIRAVEETGVYTVDSGGDYVTPLVGRQGACAFAIRSGGVVSCAIEKAYTEGKVAFQKPVSCHLYPVRITSYKNFDAVNYHEWEICSPACALGASLRVPVYRFVKDGLIRKYGTAWYEQLSRAAEIKQAEKISR